MKSLNVQIAEALDPTFVWEGEYLNDTEKYRQLVLDYEHDLNAVMGAYLARATVNCTFQIMQWGEGFICWLWYEAKAQGATPQEAAARALLDYLRQTSPTIDALYENFAARERLTERLSRIDNGYHHH